MVCLCNVHAFPVMLAFVEHKYMFTYLLSYLTELFNDADDTMEETTKSQIC